MEISSTVNRMYPGNRSVIDYQNSEISTDASVSFPKSCHENFLADEDPVIINDPTDSQNRTLNEASLTELMAALIVKLGKNTRKAISNQFIITNFIGQRITCNPKYISWESFLRGINKGKEKLKWACAFFSSNVPDSTSGRETSTNWNDTNKTPADVKYFDQHSEISHQNINTAKKTSTIFGRKSDIREPHTEPSGSSNEETFDKYSTDNDELIIYDFSNVNGNLKRQSSQSNFHSLKERSVKLIRDHLVNNLSENIRKPVQKKMDTDQQKEMDNGSQSNLIKVLCREFKLSKEPLWRSVKYIAAKGQDQIKKGFVSFESQQRKLENNINSHYEKTNTSKAGNSKNF